MRTDSEIVCTRSLPIIHVKRTFASESFNLPHQEEFKLAGGVSVLLHRQKGVQPLVEIFHRVLHRNPHRQCAVNGASRDKHSRSSGPFDQQIAPQRKPHHRPNPAYDPTDPPPRPPLKYPFCKDTGAHHPKPNEHPPYFQPAIECHQRNMMQARGSKEGSNGEACATEDKGKRVDTQDEYVAEKLVPPSTPEVPQGCGAPWSVERRRPLNGVMSEDENGRYGT